jgi:murein DD-endopeptidase MepM/ murein hydrolase activator NlpD
MNPIQSGRIPTNGILSFMYYRGIKSDGTPHYHRGIDIPAPLGTPVKAAEGGVVFEAVESFTPGFSGYGKTVVVKSDRGIYYLYGHLDSISVSKNNRVSTGQKIGTVGITAYTNEDPTGNLKNRAPHLHFEVSDSKYPKAAEAWRLNPVDQLRRLEGASPLVFVALLCGLGAWYYIKR